MAEREVILALFAGIPGCGKTTLANKFVQTLGQKKCLIIDPDGMEDKWKIYPQIDVSNIESLKTIRGPVWSYAMSDKNLMFKNIYNHFKDGLIVFDDARNYASANLESGLRDLLRRKRQMMTDIIFCAHGYTEMPPVLFKFATHHALFQTNDNIVSRKNDLYPFEAYYNKKKEIDKKAVQNKYYYEWFATNELMQKL